MCLASMTTRTEIIIGDTRGDDFIHVPVEITDAHREQAADEILDDFRLMSDVVNYLSCDEASARLAHEFWYTDDARWLATCKLLRDNDEAFKVWWTQRNAERIHNRAVDIACEQAERDYRGKK